MWFPNPYTQEPKFDGFVAYGGDLSPERLLFAYSYGFFPWTPYKLTDEPDWFCPLERYVIFPDEIHISHSMKTLLNKNPFRFTTNASFGHVIRSCATVNKRHEHEYSWLGGRMMAAYRRMHQLGVARSIEVSRETENGLLVVGGLYGMEIGNAFIGESMFSKESNASKAALIYLARLYKEKGWKFIDCQLKTDFFESMGGRYIPYDEYLHLMHGHPIDWSKGSRVSREWKPFTGETFRTQDWTLTDKIE